MLNKLVHLIKEQAKARAWFDDEDAVRRVCLDGEPCPTACPDGCEVEPEGTCPHGYDSYYKIMALDFWPLD